MNFILFYGKVESLNHFTDELADQFRHQGHNIYVLDLNDSEKITKVDFLNSFDAAICYDCIGTFSQADMADVWEIPVINILMDHPMSFGYCMKNPPPKYIQLSPDENHVLYAKRFFGINNTFFLPHMASIETPFERVSIENKTIGVLFPGSMASCDEMYQEIKEQWPQDNIRLLVLRTIEYLIYNPSSTVEDAMELCLKEKLGITLSNQSVATFLKYSKKIDVFIRIYFRSRVIRTVADAGVPLTIIGGGGINFGKKNQEM